MALRADITGKISLQANIEPPRLQADMVKGAHLFPITISSVVPLVDVFVGYNTPIEEIPLPGEFTANLNIGEPMQIPVNAWSDIDYEPDQSGEHIFVASYDLPEGIEGSKPEVTVKVIVATIVLSVDPIDDIEVEYGMPENQITFPATIRLNISNGTYEDVTATWSSETYDPETSGEHIFTADYEMPEGIAGTKPVVTLTVIVPELIPMMVLGCNNSRLFLSNDIGDTATEAMPAGSNNRLWRTPGVSKTGETILIGCRGTNGRLYLSTDAGETWTQVTPAGSVDRDWERCLVSDNGEIMVAYVNHASNGRIYISKNNGSTFSELQPAGNTARLWRGGAMTPDGQTIVMAGYGGRAYITTNAGNSWSQLQPQGNVNLNYLAAAINKEGDNIILTTDTRIYQTKNQGSTWAELRPKGDVDRFWQGACMSESGQIIGFCINSTANGELITSNDGGDNWTVHSSLGFHAWQNVVCSPDGSTLIAGKQSWPQLSKDAGQTFSELTIPGFNPGLNTWIGLATTK
jgi:photosystem II stability/assembly factor-like uncharacterized protein